MGAARTALSSDLMIRPYTLERADSGIRPASSGFVLGGAPYGARESVTVPYCSPSMPGSTPMR